MLNSVLVVFRSFANFVGLRNVYTAATNKQSCQHKFATNVLTINREMSENTVGTNVILCYPQ